MYYSLVNIDENIVITFAFKVYLVCYDSNCSHRTTYQECQGCLGLLQFHRKTTVLPEVTVGIVM
jgi:hypothetical protein